MSHPKDKQTHTQVYLGSKGWFYSVVSVQMIMLLPRYVGVIPGCHKDWLSKSIFYMYNFLLLNYVNIKLHIK